jgi:hypothetical protein
LTDQTYRKKIILFRLSLLILPNKNQKVLVGLLEILAKYEVVLISAEWVMDFSNAAQGNKSASSINEIQPASTQQQARAIRISYALEDLTEKYIKLHSELFFLAKMVFF